MYNVKNLLKKRFVFVLLLIIAFSTFIYIIFSLNSVKQEVNEVKEENVTNSPLKIFDPFNIDSEKIKLNIPEGYRIFEAFYGNKNEYQCINNSSELIKCKVYTISNGDQQYFISFLGRYNKIHNFLISEEKNDINIDGIEYTEYKQIVNLSNDINIEPSYSTLQKSICNADFCLSSGVLSFDTVLNNTLSNESFDQFVLKLFTKK